MRCDKCLREDKAERVERVIQTLSSYREVRVASRTPLLTQPKASEGLPCGSELKNPPASAGDTGSIPGSGRSPGEGNGNPHQYSCLENPTVRGAWQATVYGVARVRHNWAPKPPRPIFLPRKSHGQRSLIDYSLWVHKESDTTYRLSKNSWHMVVAK